MFRHLFSFCSFILVFSMLSAQHPAGTSQQMSMTSPKFVSMTVAQFDSLIVDTSVVLLDVRTPKEYAEGHIARASNALVWGQNFPQLLANAQLSKNKALAVYCRSGRRSKQAATQLAAAGYTVYELDRGIVGWMQAAKPLVK